ncbi:MAG: outer membrane beta-barrel protein [Solitalea-like symbiont of Tyrophagus putrescentiae]
MRFGKKIFTVLLFSILTFSAVSINAQEINKTSIAPTSSPFNFGIEAAFMGQYFTIKGGDVKNNGLRPGFGINVLAEYAFTADGSFLGTIEPGMSFTSGRFYRNAASGSHFHTKKSLTNLNIPITAKYIVYDSVPVGLFVQGGIVPGINLSQKSDNLTNGEDKAQPHVPSHEKSFYLGAIVAVGINLHVLPTGSLQARIGWEPTFTNIGNGDSTAKSSLRATAANPNANLNTDIKQNFLFFGLAYKF